MHNGGEEGKGRRRGGEREEGRIMYNIGHSYMGTFSIQFQSNTSNVCLYLDCSE